MRSRRQCTTTPDFLQNLLCQSTRLQPVLDTREHCHDIATCIRESSSLCLPQLAPYIKQLTGHAFPARGEGQHPPASIRRITQRIRDISRDHFISDADHARVGQPEPIRQLPHCKRALVQKQLIGRSPATPERYAPGLVNLFCRPEKRFCHAAKTVVENHRSELSDVIHEKPAEKGGWLRKL